MNIDEIAVYKALTRPFARTEVDAWQGGFRIEWKYKEADRELFLDWVGKYAAGLRSIAGDKLVVNGLEKKGDEITATLCFDGMDNRNRYLDTFNFSENLEHLREVAAMFSVMLEGGREICYGHNQLLVPIVYESRWDVKNAVDALANLVELQKARLRGDTVYWGGKEKLQVEIGYDGWRFTAMYWCEGY